jgi:hypothetical protein
MTHRFRQTVMRNEQLFLPLRRSFAHRHRSASCLPPKIGSAYGSAIQDFFNGLLRRAFASYNANTLGAVELQRMMRHRSFATTQAYINMSTRMKDAVKKLTVPDVLVRKNM